MFGIASSFSKYSDTKIFLAVVASGKKIKVKMRYGILFFHFFDQKVAPEKIRKFGDETVLYTMYYANPDAMRNRRTESNPDGSYVRLYSFDSGLFTRNPGGGGKNISAFMHMMIRLDRMSAV